MIKTPKELTTAIHKCLEEYAKGYTIKQEMRLAGRMIKEYLDNPEFYDVSFECENGHSLFLAAQW